LCYREYHCERQIKLASRRLRTKTDCRLRGNAGDPVARLGDELATVKLLVKAFNLGLRGKLLECCRKDNS
jgi:hypothetical protein